MIGGDVAGKDGSDQEQVRREQDRGELDLLAHLAQAAVAEAEEDGEEDDSKRSEGPEQWLGVRNAGYGSAVGCQDDGEEGKTAQKKGGDEAGNTERRSRLRRVCLSQDPVGVTVQGSLRLLVAPRTQHRKRAREKRDSGNSQARIYFGSSSTSATPGGGGSRRVRRISTLMTASEGWGAHKEHHAEHQGGGLPLSIHGCLQQLRTGSAVIPKVEVAVHATGGPQA
jgi:hypothetical protein